jgi:hypothetical protein
VIRWVYPFNLIYALCVYLLSFITAAYYDHRVAGQFEFSGV